MEENIHQIYLIINWHLGHVKNSYTLIRKRQRNQIFKMEKGLEHILHQKAIPVAKNLKKNVQHHLSSEKYKRKPQGDNTTQPLE